ncbi:MAG: crossover junction endodeoxyribonuclease RuvC [Candidatus Krumholzibacteria bacterium]|jgi:crossover junction endodeoxyribonuclease RuvC|nr:crossover junction endodeoxyribonuclease RuvC [Candidatus Krumholzibacteria bacterium]
MAACTRILGIDPGSHATGWGVVQVRPALRYLASGVVRPGRQLDLPARLLVIHEQLAEIIDRYAPQIMAVESLFQARNARSALILGHARGAALLAGARRGLAVYEYAPGAVKQALTGNGQASKQQVRYMVRRLLQFAELPALDESDALAVALTHESRGRLPVGRVAEGRA